MVRDGRLAAEKAKLNTCRSKQEQKKEMKVPFLSTLSLCKDNN